MEDDYDLSSEIEEERQERHDSECARLDWKQGIRRPFDEPDNDDHE
jgi:hypothetical protein